MTTTTGTYYPIEDWLGSLTGLTNSTGTQVTSTTYSPYGTPSTTSLTPGAPTPSIGYAGSYTLPGSTGLDDMRARDYNPATSQFTSVDLFLNETGTPYAYTDDSPVAGTDISGLCSSWNLFCRAIQPHWRGIAQGAVDVTVAVGMGVCIGVTGGDCAVLTPLAGAAAGAINNAIAGPGSQSLADYGQAVGEGFAGGSIGIICPACMESPLVAASMVSGISAAFGVNGYIGSTQCASMQGAIEAAILGAASAVGYPFDKEAYSKLLIASHSQAFVASAGGHLP
jgi:RHS repeat-associated protein